MPDTTPKAGAFDALNQPIPFFEWRKHDVSSIGAVLWNNGSLGFFEYPLNSNLEHIQYGQFLFGCVRGQDTLVSNNSTYPHEFQSLSHIEEYSNHVDEGNYSPSSVADQEYRTVFVDTLHVPGSTDPIELRPHKPIGLSVTQRTYAWSGGFARSIIIAEWWLKNLSDRPISGGVVGLRVGPAVLWSTNWPTDVGLGDGHGFFDNYLGFTQTAPGVVAGIPDTLELVWWADNDGDPHFGGGSFSSRGPRSAMGLRLLRTPSGNGQLSFNWWVRTYSGKWPPNINWGPRRTKNRALYEGSVGFPVGDRGTYYMMTNGEVDYDSPYAAIDFSVEGWESPSRDSDLAEDIARGSAPEFILSYGPIDDIAPGDSVPFTVAFVAGPDFHTDPSNYANNLNVHDPSKYLSNLDFSNLYLNARWADWWFDNPGVDTDGDGYRGRAYLVNCRENGICDSIFYKGDGVPDWRGPGPPPSPRLTITTHPNEAIVEWTGARSETIKDAFSQQRDWEGYRLYAGRFAQDDQMSLLASWDREDYVRMEYRPGSRRWRPISYPHTPDEWRALIPDDHFNVTDYLEQDPANAYVDIVADTLRDTLGVIVAITERERLSTWAPEDYNQGNEYDDNGRIRANIIQRVGERDTVIADDTLTFGVYRAHLSGFNAGIPLYIGVSAFDYGDIMRDFPASESGPSAEAEYVEFINTPDVVVDSGLKVTVFPNPYKLAYQDIHGNWHSYYQEGYEGREVVEFAEQDRRIHFINLPDTATISIYTLDGDLVRRIHHPDPFLTTYPSSVGWDLVTRNVQAAVSGIYIWKVDSRLGSQTGKLVIIK